ncbi:FAD-binding dehydrogenase [Bhargavaea beijingensis]|uniref:FAD-binding dehydrogenase n=1 Tax=Bhargavaea beijingensis TaxID=426756 RepID=A0ABX9ZDV6_9BACL|nr:FAD-binding dehydrogenase [Bhargavaea beijingensis]MCW1928037.1 FAD-binding dehydrogenase [Bhargavaea beijingensis]RSK34265.1 FAD-binding dehydrogenase [Bhargavaea beijingensis]
MDYDVITVGHGLAGLVATAELADAGKKVLLLDQEPASNIGGQAWWSFGGLFLVDSPEQRRMGIKDSHELAWQDWIGTAGFDRMSDEDEWGYQWAKAYVDFAAGGKRAWLRSLGVRFFPVVGWAERGGSLADGHGNSVPRFHIVWGTGPGIVKPFAERVRQGIRDGHVHYLPRHRVTDFVTENGAVTGVRGEKLVEDDRHRGEKTSRQVERLFEVRAGAVLMTSGGIGGNHELVRKNWPERLGGPPGRMLSGVPAYVDGQLLGAAEQAGGRLVNRDRMWHYTEGIRNYDPVWPHHGIRILPGPSPLWFDAEGQRFGAPNFPGFDTLSTLEAIGKSGYDYSWFVLTKKMIEKEFALSGSEQNPDLTGKSIRMILSRVLPGAPEPVEKFMKRGEDFVVARTLPELVDGMNDLVGEERIFLEEMERQIRARDREIDNKFAKDLQVMAIRSARASMGDKLVRVAPPHRVLDPAAGPLIAVRLNIVSRKTLGGLQTNLSGQVLGADGEPVPGLYAAGEAAGFGGGGVHGYRSLEGTFLGGCLFSGRQAGRALGKD